MNPIDSGSNALLRLRAYYSSLRSSEKRIADYILSNPDEIIYLSITMLAKKVRVSETSVIRLCKAIGYHGFQDFKINIAKCSIQPNQQIYENITEGDQTSDILRKVMNSNAQAILDTMELLNIDQVEAAVKAISITNRLEFYGLGGSGAVAADAHHKFFKLCPFSAYYIDPHMQAMSASTLKKGDVVIAISHTGYTKDLVESMKIASEAGATTICITGGIQSPITEVCDIVLSNVSKEQSYRPEPMSSRIAQLSIIDVLATSVAFTRPSDVLKNLEKTRDAISSKRF